MTGRATYTVAVVGDHHRHELAAALADAFRAVGLDEFADLRIQDRLTGIGPAVAVADWREGSDPAPVLDLVAQAEMDEVLVIPVVEDIDAIPADFPAPLSTRNAVGWAAGEGLRQIVRACLRELGVHERQRRVFISHKRSDAAGLALDLHDRLRRAGWIPFVDRLGIDEGAFVREKIDECLDDMAFLLLIESPEANQSMWIDHEVLYAYSHNMGVLVVNVDDAPRVATAADFQPLRIGAAQVTRDGSQIQLAADALDEIVAAAEVSHAAALSRRRRALVVSTRAAARLAGRAVDYLPGWRLRVEGNHATQVVSHIPCLPIAEDLHEVDNLRGESERGIVVHAAHAIPGERRRILDWMSEHRDLELVPGNAIGSYWQVET